MPYKYLLLVVAFYFISVIQSSFLSHFVVFGVAANLSLVLVCLITFLSNTRSYAGVVAATASGVFLDLLGGSFFGVSIFAMLLAYLIVKKSLVYLVDFPKEYSILYFIPILAISTIFYGFIINFLSGFSALPVSLYFNGWAILLEALFNVVLGVIGFYVFRMISLSKYELK